MCWHSGLTDRTGIYWHPQKDGDMGPAWKLIGPHSSMPGTRFAGTNVVPYAINTDLSRIETACYARSLFEAPDPELSVEALSDDLQHGQDLAVVGVEHPFGSPTTGQAPVTA